MAFISADCLVCERVLQETDSVFTIIRVVNLFTLTPFPGIPIESLPASLCFFANVQFSSDDESKHTISLIVIRPSGDENEKPALTDQQIPVGKIPEMPRSVALIARMSVAAKELGIHQIVLKVDGREVARTQFFLALAKSAETPPQDLPDKRSPTVQ
jgi:hypothetical protein